MPRDWSDPNAATQLPVRDWSDPSAPTSPPVRDWSYAAASDPDSVSEKAKFNLRSTDMGLSQIGKTSGPGLLDTAGKVLTASPLPADPDAYFPTARPMPKNLPPAAQAVGGVVDTAYGAARGMVSPAGAVMAGGLGAGGLMAKAAQAGLAAQGVSGFKGHVQQAGEGIGVGDPRQAAAGFTGAAGDIAMVGSPMLASELQARITALKQTLWERAKANPNVTPEMLDAMKSDTKNVPAISNTKGQAVQPSTDSGIADVNLRGEEVRGAPEAGATQAVDAQRGPAAGLRPEQEPGVGAREDPLDAYLSPKNLQAAYKLPNGQIKITGTNHDINAVPRGLQNEAEQGFVDREGKWVGIGDIQNRIVAGTRGGAGEVTLDTSQAPSRAEAEGLGVKFDQDYIKGQQATQEATGGKAGLSTEYVDPNAKPLEHFSKKAARKNSLLSNPFTGGGMHNMNETAVAAPDIAQTFGRSAGAEAGMKASVLKAEEFIDQELGEGVADKFARTMSQSQQNGNARRWADLSKEVIATAPEDIPRLYREHNWDNELAKINETNPGVLQNAEDLLGPAGLNRTPGRVGLSESMRIGQLRQYLSDTFQNASAQVTPILSPEEYQANLQSPWFARAKEIAGKTFLDELHSQHVQNEGHLLKPEYLGETGTYWPMTGKAAAERAAQGLGPKTTGGFTAPGNPLNRQRGGLASEYDTSWKAVSDKAGLASWANTRASAIDQAVRVGLLQEIPEGAPRPEFVDWQGVKYTAQTRGGYSGPKWFMNEAGPILDRGQRSSLPEPVGGIAGAITKVNMAAKVDALFHNINQIGVGTAFAPSLGDTATGRMLSYIPGFKTARAAGGLSKTLTGAIGPEDWPEVRQMINNREWYPRFTEDKSALMPMSETDLRGRMDMRRALLREMPKATPQELYEASTRYGEYNPALAPNLIRSMKNSAVGQALSPFVVAGNAMPRNALNTLRMGFGKGAFSQGGTTAALTGGIPAAIGTWMAINKAVTGKFPDTQDPDFKFLSVPLRKTDDGRTVYLNTGRITSPMGNRGASTSGTAGAINTLSKDGSPQQALNAAQQDQTNAALHMFAGPAVRVATRLAFGVDPQLDFSGGHVSFRRAAAPTDNIPDTIKERSKAALEGLNPGVETASRQQSKWWDDQLKPWEQSWSPLRILGMVSVQDNDTERRFLARDQQSTQRQIRSYMRKQDQ